MKVKYLTLGCKLNYAETAAISKILESRGHTAAQAAETPDLIVLNSCSVTDVADKKGRQLIRREHKLHPEAVIIVTGCYAQLKPDEVASLPGVRIVLGSNEKLLIDRYLEKYLADSRPITAVSRTTDIRTFRPSCERGNRTRYFLKVQDGCDYYCTYCTIPYARGRSRSATVKQMVEEARQVAAEGGKEIVLTGVNIGDFGKRSDATGETFFDLIRALDSVDGIARYRISSIEPNLLTDEIIDWVATKSRAFMPHFHIPLQAGSDEVLSLMHRHYDTTLFRHRIEHIRHSMPDAFIGVDVIAGARGETAELWQKGLAFIESLDISRLHVFPYSERPGTKALQIGHVVSQEEKHRRVALLTELSDHKLASYRARFAGTERPVLWEHLTDHGTMTGHTDNYLPVEAPADINMLNRISNFKL